MNVHCTATVDHTNLEIDWATVVEIFCINSTVSLHFNNYVTTFLAEMCSLFTAMNNIDQFSNPTCSIHNGALSAM